MEQALLKNMRDVEAYDSCYVIQTSTDEISGLYVVEDDIFEGKVLDGILELAVKFESVEKAQSFLKEMNEHHISGVIKKAHMFIAVEG